MSTMLLEQNRTTSDQSTDKTPTVTPTIRPRRPARGTGRSQRPQARPAGAIRPPVVGGSAASVAPHSCRVEPRPMLTVASASRWRLTERGIALVLVTAVVIAVAAVAVIGLTAFRVTGEQYRPYGQSQLLHP